MNTIETCGAAAARVLIVSDEAELAGSLDDYDGSPVICIENGAGHSYVITGTLGELTDFAAKMAVAVLGVEAVYEHLPRCASCGRIEGVCSRNPCQAVIADRCEDDPDLIARELKAARETCEDCVRAAHADAASIWTGLHGKPASCHADWWAIGMQARDRIADGSSACDLHRPAPLAAAS